MLGPFRIRNLRRPSSPQPYRPTSPTQSQSQVSLRSRKSSKDDGPVLWVEGEKYDRTVEEHPAAKLQYLDEDKDVITVGSKEELAQRLEEPVRTLRRPHSFLKGRTMVFPSSSPGDMHVFQIDPMEANLKIWREIEQQTGALAKNEEATNSADPTDGKVNRDTSVAPTEESTTAEAGEKTTPGFANSFTNEVREQHFRNTNPPTVGPESSHDRVTPGLAPAGNAPPLAFPSEQTVLTEAGRRQAQEIGQRLSSMHRSFGNFSQEPMKLQSGDADNRWASYSTALQPSPTKHEQMQPARPAKSKYLAPEQPSKASVSINDEASVGSAKGAALESLFFEYLQAKLAKLLEDTPPTDRPKSLDVNYSKDNGTEDAKSSNKGAKKPHTKTRSSRIPREEYPAVSRALDSEESKPLLPNEEDLEPGPAYTLLGTKSHKDANETMYQEHDENQLVSELIRRGLVSPSTTYESLAKRLKNDSDGHVPAKERTEKTTPERPLSDPVEVTVGKMMMQMVSSVISNLSTLNSQIQGTARSQIPQEALRLRGYPDAAHANDLFRDIETLKDAFAEFDVATCDIMRSFERMHDHDEFPTSSGMLRLQGFSSVRGPLPQIATALQNLAQSIQTTCIPAVGEMNGRLQYHIPRRIATAGYEDTWELFIHPVPFWATRESHVKEFVEKTVREYGSEVSISKVRFAHYREASFEVKGRDNADNVLRSLYFSHWDNEPIDVSMQRKLYPSVFDAKSSTGSAGSHHGSSLEVSGGGTTAPQTVSTKAKLDLTEKRKAIQDRRAAWRREYKARTQGVRFEELNTFKEPSNAANPRNHEFSGQREILPSSVQTASLSLPFLDENRKKQEVGQDKIGVQSTITHPSHQSSNFISAQDHQVSKRMSMPVIPKRSRSRSRSRSPDSSVRTSHLRRMSSVQAELWPTPEPFYSHKALNQAPLAGQVEPTPWSKSKNSPAKHNAREIAYKDSKKLPPLVPTVKATVLDNQLPTYPFGSEPTQISKDNVSSHSDVNGGKESPILPSEFSGGPSSQGRIPVFPLAADLSSKRASFPPLPTMEPLIPQRSTTSHHASFFKQSETKRLSVPAAKIKVSLPKAPRTNNETEDVIVPWNASKKLYVGKLPGGMNVFKIKDLFGKYGRIQKIDFRKDAPPDGPEDFMYVEYEDIVSAVKACNALAGYRLENTKLYVGYCPVGVPIKTQDERAESSGAFSRRMMGRSPPPQAHGLPISSPGPVPSSPDPHVIHLPEVPKWIPFSPNQPTSLSNKSDARASDKFITGPSLSRSSTTKSMNGLHAKAREPELRRSATTIDRDRKTPSGPWSRRPYSNAFDGAGREYPERFSDLERKLTAQPLKAPVPPAKIEVKKEETEEIKVEIKDEVISPKPAKLLQIPTDWREQSKPVPAERPVSPIPTHEDPETARVIEECVTRMKDLGYGSENDGGKERLVVIAQAAGGDLEDAIDIIEEEKRAWGERTSI